MYFMTGIEIIKNSKKVILLEPNYKRKYIPLGLAKISTLVKQNGGTTIYQRKYSPQGEDLVCITSLFTYDSQLVIDAITDVYSHGNTNIILGGVFASLMPNHIQEKFPNIHIFRGCSDELDACVPDYSIDYGLKDDWNKFSFLFTTRGCPNKCSYCSVWKIEPDMCINTNWRDHILADKPYVMISDNNLSAQPIEHIEQVCNYIVENKKRVVFDNGFDCKHITDEIAELLSKPKYYKTGLRLAFDRIEEDGIFQDAIRTLLRHGVRKSWLMSYCLFNFTDTPQEANYRMRECVKLGVRPYPQQYTPLNKLNRDNPYIGKHWSKQLLKSFRFFWLMAGYYGKYEFEDWVKNKAPENYKLANEDWKLFNYVKL